MSATAVQEKGQPTLPADVSEAAGIKPGDQIEWRFEQGEIRGRKLPSEPKRIVGKLVQKGDALILEAEGYQIDPEDIGRAVREERDRH